MNLYEIIKDDLFNGTGSKTYCKILVKHKIIQKTTNAIKENRVKQDYKKISNFLYHKKNIFNTTQNFKLKKSSYLSTNLIWNSRSRIELQRKYNFVPNIKYWCIFMKSIWSMGRKFVFYDFLCSTNFIIYNFKIKCPSKFRLYSSKYDFFI